MFRKIEKYQIENKYFVASINYSLLILTIRNNVQYIYDIHIVYM